MGLIKVNQPHDKGNIKGFWCMNTGVTHGMRFDTKFEAEEQAKIWCSEGTLSFVTEIDETGSLINNI